MNRTFACHVIALLLLVVVLMSQTNAQGQGQSQQPGQINTNPQPAPQPNQEVSMSSNVLNCNRQVTASTSNNGYTYDLKATNLCQNQNSTNMNRKAVINFQFNSQFIPNLHIAGYKNSKDVNAAFGARLLVDRIVEYTDANGVAGFQPAADTVVKTYDLIGRQWSKVQKSSVVSDSTTQAKVVKMSTTLTPPDANFVASQITVGAMVTEQDITYNNSTVKVVLTPNSVKSIFEMDNIRYQASGNSSRLAIGLLFIVRGDVIRRNDTVTSGPDGDRPYDPTGNQTVARLTDPSQSADAGFFSWQRFVVRRLVGGLVVNSPLIETNVTLESASGSSYQMDSQTEAGYKIMRVWLALQDRVDNLSWDPSVGSAEEQVSVQDTNTNSSPVSSSAGIKKGVDRVLLFFVVALLTVTYLF